MAYKKVEYTEELIRKLCDKLGNHNITLTQNINFKTVGDTVYVHIKNPDLNMQDNEACFEGWIIALKHHLDYKRFVFDWNNDNMIKKNGDYNRFLFRVHKFKNMFKDSFKFEMEKDKEHEIEKFIEKLKVGENLLNEPSGPKEYRKQGISISEDFIEGLFSGKYRELLMKKANSKEINSQLPVGVFKEKIKIGNEIFTAKKSAIDLWGVNDETKTISIFELKYNNIRMGIVSELLFYMYVLEELCISKDGLFKYLNTKKSFRGAEHFKNNKKYNSLKGYFLTDRLHPLITEGYINELNEGLKKLGDLKIENILYDYHNEKILLF